MPKENSWMRIPRLNCVIGLSSAAFLYAGTALAQSPAPAPGALREPPKLNYQKTCSLPAPLLPLSADWSQWNGQDNGVSAERMLADAARLTDGDTEVHRDRVAARKILTFVASGSSMSAPDAKARLALLLLDPRSGPVDPEQAARLLAEATASQRTGAALSMGRLIREGRLPGLTMADASRYLSIAAGLGDPIAALQLAGLYGRPDVTPPFPNAASHFATLAAISVQTALASGNCGIAADVGDYLVEMDPQQGPLMAARWFEIGVMAGDSRAMVRLARAYESGMGKERDTTKARALWDQAAAAGSVRGMVQAARLRLVQGEEVEAAVTLLTAAMASGDPDAYLLAARFYRGDYTGKADVAAMHAVLEAAVRQPDVSVFSIDMLANAYLTGQGVSADKERADALYQSLLKQADPEGEALFGRYLINHGLGLSSGLDHLRHAAEKGATAGLFQQAQLASCMADAQADRLMQRAVEAGNTAALRRLARSALERGDQQEAIKRWREAIALGDRLAMVDLASLAASATPVQGINVADLIRRAAAPGEGVIDGRLALAIAFDGGKLGGAADEGSRLLSSLADSGRADVEVALAKRSIAAGDEPGVFVPRLIRAAETGDEEAMLLLARLPQEALPPGEAARDWLIRAAAAGDAEAMDALTTEDTASVERVLASLKERALCDVPSLIGSARLHRLHGDPTSASADLDRAERLADGRPRDLHLLAQALLAKAPGAAEDQAKAALLLERAAGAGYVKSSLALADLYAGGALGSRDADAVEWFFKAALGGEAAGVRGLVKYAQTGQQGLSEKAMTALQQVAEKDDAAAMQAYGSVLATLGPDRYGEGMAFLEKAAGKGDVQAMKTLARLYAAGLNGKVSAEESTRWTRQAAEKGDPEAMFQYAIALDLGFGVTIDRSLAQSWHEKAKQNGFLR